MLEFLGLIGGDDTPKQSTSTKSKNNVVDRVIRETAMALMMRDKLIGEGTRKELAKLVGQEVDDSHLAVFNFAIDHVAKALFDSTNQ